MKKHKISLCLALLLAPVGSEVIAATDSQKFTPSTTPIFSTPRAKPSIHMVYDDSGSMLNKDIWMPEHGLGFGKPECTKPKDSWGWIAEREKLGEYNPFIDGKYVPWDDNKAVNGLIDGKKKPPRLEGCLQLTRSEALEFAYQSIMYKYRDKAYLGASFLWQANDDVESQDGQSLIRLPVDDYSTLSEVDFKNEVIAPVVKSIHQAPGRTPMYPAVYEAIKMYRGQPVTANGVNGNIYKNTYVSSTKENGKEFYPYKQKQTPLHYRCQQNHLIVMTDGEPNDTRVWGIALEDNVEMTALSGPSTIVNNVNVSARTNLIDGKKIGQITSNADLRKSHKPVLDNGRWVDKALDDAGRAWTDPLSVPMPIFTHSVSLFIPPLSPIYTDMTAPTKGMNLGFAKGEGNAEDLMLAFDTIFSSIIKSTSSANADNDRTHSDVLEGKPDITGGKIDLSTIGTIRYDTTYNFSQHTGMLRAMVPYISEYRTIKDGKKSDPVIQVMELWNTNQTIKPNQGRYVTYLNNHGQDETIVDLRNPEVFKQFGNIYQSNHYDTLDAKYIDWLTNFEYVDQSGSLRARLNPLGSITNAELKSANKDVLNINVVSDKMSKGLSDELLNFLRFKAKFQEKNLMIISDNDGFINFINAQRGLTGDLQAGARDTAYFPQILAHRLDEIAKDERNPTLVFEGKTNLVDAKVYQPKVGDMYATIGLSSMGSGGKGIVGYRIYAATDEMVEDWTNKKIKPGNIAHDDPIDKVLPLFEITNEGPNAYRTKGFENLGYTYSGFEYFNRLIPTDNGEFKGQAVGIFGNGFGTDKSSLYFIDAYTGEKLNEIVLNTNGGGASTPSIIVKAAKNGLGQTVNLIYVGDYTGNLYKVEFNGKDFMDNQNIRVTNLFKVPEIKGHYGQTAISVKPLVTKDSKTGLYQISFGTGSAASTELDRGKNSMVEHSIYTVIDRNKKTSSSTATAAQLANSATLTPALTLNDLKGGKVEYKNGQSIDYLKEETHELEMTEPKALPNQKAEDGWYVRLIADGTESGERTIRNPQYDSMHDDIIFSTWGIYERNTQYTPNGLDDPCLADIAFGKVLAFNVGTGKASYKIKGANHGKTGTAEGEITGDWIDNDPEGNSETDLDAIDKNLKEEIIEIVGADDSTHATDEVENIGLHCIGDIFGKPECVETDRKNKVLTKKRINVKHLYKI